VTKSTDSVLVKREMTVKGDAESLYSVGKGHQGASNADSSEWKVVTKFLPSAKSDGFRFVAV
jgi:hypothetical protein